MFSPRLGCSSISFRRQPLPEALATIREAGFEEIDLGALPGVCDHVPFVLDRSAVLNVATVVRNSGLRIRSVNGDTGDLNAVLDDGQKAARLEHLRMLLQLTADIGAQALVLPCGALSHEPIRSLEDDLDAVASELIQASVEAERFGVQIWTESLHYFRLCWNVDRARQLADRLRASEVGIVLDLSHVVASGSDPVPFIAASASRIRHVHLRDAVPGNINLSIGKGSVDFAAAIAALNESGYKGHFSLELETHDVAEDERTAAAVSAAQLVSSLLSTP